VLGRSTAMDSRARSFVAVVVGLALAGCDGKIMCPQGPAYPVSREECEGRRRIYETGLPVTTKTVLLPVAATVVGRVASTESIDWTLLKVRIDNGTGDRPHVDHYVFAGEGGTFHVPADFQLEAHTVTERVVKLPPAAFPRTDPAAITVTLYGDR
jgi:hypothetical protein